MNCRLLTKYAIIMVQVLAGLRKIKLLPGYNLVSSGHFQGRSQPLTPGWAR